MGEAKRRGSFEDRKKQARKKIIRGIINYPYNTSLQGSSINFSPENVKREMYYLAMYWDKIITPTGAIRGRFQGDDAFITNDVLRLVNTLDYAPHPSSLSEDGKFFDAVRHDIWVMGEIATDKRENAQGEIWDINHVTEQPVYFNEHAKEANIIRMRLTNVLPYPIITDEYNIEDLLKFKERRSEQLIALHDSMDNLLKRIYEEPMHALKEKEIMRFENAVHELDRTLIERFKITDKSDLELNLSVDTSLIEKASAIGIAMAADHTLNPFPFFTAATTALSLFSLSKTYGVTFNRYAHDDIKLEYISRAKAKKIVP